MDGGMCTFLLQFRLLYEPELGCYAIQFHASSLLQKYGVEAGAQAGER